MPYSIYPSKTSNKLPHRMLLISVVCDGDHGFFDAPSATFEVGSEHPRDPAVRAGWTFNPDGPVYCRECP